MKIDYSNLKFCEVSETDGIQNIAVIDGLNGNDTVRYIPVHDLINPKEDQIIIDMVNAMCWPSVGKIDPYFREGGYDLNREDPESIQEQFQRIAMRIARVLERSMYFKDERYAAVVINFIFNSYFKDAFHFAPRIILLGSTVSGKSRLQEIVSGLCYRGFWTQRPTFAALKRLMNMYRITPLVDEVQRLKGQARNDLDEIFFSGDQKGRKLTSVNMISLKTEAFNTFGPMLISLKAGGYTEEDQDNRSFMLYMLENRSKQIDPALDLKEIESIRTDLYSLYALYKIHPEAFNFDKLIEESTRWLTERDPKTGECISDQFRSDERTPIKGRALDIARTYYTLSRLTFTEEDVLSVLSEEQRHASDRLKDSTEAGIFHSLMICCRNKSNDISAGWGYEDIIEKVSTKEITDCYNALLQDTGNQRNTMDSITGNRVTRVLQHMGFKTRSGTGRMTFITYTNETDGIIDLHLYKFGSEEDQDIMKYLKRRPARGK